MRKVIDLQMEFWKKDIAKIEFDLKSRDEIPKLLMGLQPIYLTLPIRNKVFDVLKQIVPKQSYEFGRQGMDLWKIQGLICPDSGNRCKGLVIIE